MGEKKNVIYKGKKIKTIIRLLQAILKVKRKWSNVF
jgi:hypothetical protein